MARTDTERLDWMEQRVADVVCNYSHPHAWQVCLEAADFDPDCRTTYTGTSPRAAIDAAMDAGSEKGTIPPTADEMALFRYMSESAAVVRYVARTRPGQYPEGARLPDEAIKYGYAAFRAAPLPVRG